MKTFDNLQASLDNEEMFTPYTDESIRLYLAYLGELFPHMDAQRLAGHFGVLPYNKVLAPATALKTPTAAPETDLDPQSSTLPEGRYAGTMRVYKDYAYIYPTDREKFSDDLRVAKEHVMGGLPFLAFSEPVLVEFSIMVNDVLGFPQAHRVVCVGYESSERAYKAMLSELQAPRIDTTRRPRNLAEARLQAEQRKRDAAQREQARKEAHQHQRVDYMDAFYEGPIEADSQSQQAQDVRSDLY